jgi:hypothetical protein
MVAADGEHPVPAQQVEVMVAAVVDQVGTLPGDPAAVIPEGSHDPAQLGVEIAVVERHLLALATGEDIAN